MNDRFEVYNLTENGMEMFDVVEYTDREANPPKFYSRCFTGKNAAKLVNRWLKGRKAGKPWYNAEK